LKHKITQLMHGCLSHQIQLQQLYDTLDLWLGWYMVHKYTSCWLFSNLFWVMWQEIVLCIDSCPEVYEPVFCSKYRVYMHFLFHLCMLHFMFIQICCVSPRWQWLLPCVHYIELWKVFQELIFKLFSGLSFWLQFQHHWQICNLIETVL
jgi:hypothetical protein